MKDDKGARSYVESLRDQTGQYAQDLLRENEKLRALALAVETDNQRLQEEVAAAREMVAESRTLRERLDDALRESDRLRERVEATTSELETSRADRARVVEQLRRIEQESRGIADQYATVMRQNANLANLYVSSYMLHSTLEREQVLSGIEQIVVNIVGSEDYAVLERQEDELRVVAHAGQGVTALARSERGTQAIEMLMREARVRIFDTDGGGLLALIPLSIGEFVTGAIAIFSLLPQKPRLEEADTEIFEMLSVHAATALYCASLHEQSGEVRQCEQPARS